ncbi:MAG: protein-disulfide reductase DsbD domain-containing protein [Roseibacillus sp.]
MKLLTLLTLLPALLYGQQKEEVGLDLSLVAENKSIVLGEAFTVGIHIQHEPGYHTYWKNPGIVGMATNLEWDLPLGFTASQTLWPYPELCDMAGHPCHGFERDVTLLTTITPPENTTSTEINLKVSVAWMCCAQGCYPGSKELSLALPISLKSHPHPKHSLIIKKAKKEVPQPSNTWTAHLLSRSDEAPLTLTFKGPPGEEPQYFFSSDGQISSDQKQAFRKTDSGTWELSITRAKFSPRGKKSLPGILKTSLTFHQVSVSPQ